MSKDHIDKIARLITEDPDIFDNFKNPDELVAILLNENIKVIKGLIINEQSNGHDKEVAWEKALNQVYDFVYRVPAHIMGDPSCSDCWDSRGVDLFYGGSGSGFWDVESEAQVRDRLNRGEGNSEPARVLIPNNAKKLQVKSGLTMALEHVVKWHQIRRTGGIYDFPVLVVGNPPRNLDENFMNELESKGCWFSDEVSSRSPNEVKIIEKLVDLVSRVESGSRGPLSDEEIAKFKSPKGYRFKSSSRISKFGEEEKGESEAQSSARIKQAKIGEKDWANRKFVELMGSSKGALEGYQDLSSVYYKKRRRGKLSPDDLKFGKDLVEKASLEIDEFDKFFEQVKSKLNHDNLEKYDNFRQELIELKRSIYEKVVGRKKAENRAVLTKGNTPTHDFIPLIKMKRLWSNNRGKVPCQFKIDGKTCNHAADAKIHTIKIHSFTPNNSWSGKTLCKICSLPKNKCNKKK